MIEELFSIERSATKQSIIHHLDARVKLIVVCVAIVAMVSIPYSPTVYTIAGFFFVLLLFLWGVSRLSPKIFFLRFLTAIPFGIMICGFQIFFTNRFYTEYHVLVALPLGINIFYESVLFASILLVKFLICFSFIVLLSSTTTLQDLLEGAGRLGLPSELILALGMMIRYLFVFGYMARKINQSLQARCFDAFNRNLPYRYRITQMGYTLGTMFIRSFEQGERTYMSMLCRGYGKESHIYICKKSLQNPDIFFLIAGLSYVIAVPLICWFS
ncbi:MAG: cobalt ECF transporter T component CbiQ [Methanobacteriota archaeon]